MSVDWAVTGKLPAAEEVVGAVVAVEVAAAGAAANAAGVFVGSNVVAKTVGVGAGAQLAPERTAANKPPTITTAMMGAAATSAMRLRDRRRSIGEFFSSDLQLLCPRD